jgi:hypothetical protein
MRAYRLNEYDYYAADSFEEAVACGMKATGLSREGLIDEEFCDGMPAPDNMRVFLDEQRTVDSTCKQIVDGMDEPGFAFGVDI